MLNLAALSDYIEQFLKDLLDEGSVELQRNELAEQFGCAPSQISYVLATRFTVEQGYVIESRRGGGGYIRIARLGDSDTHLLEILTRGVGREMELREAVQLIDRLERGGQVTKREAALMRAGTGKAVGPVNAGMVRSAVFREMLLALLCAENEAGEGEE